MRSREPPCCSTSNLQSKIPPAINSTMLSRPKPCSETLRVAKPTVIATQASMVIHRIVTSSIQTPRRTWLLRMELSVASRIGSGRTISHMPLSVHSEDRHQHHELHRGAILRQHAVIERL